MRELRADLQESSIPWIRAVPDHWQQTQFRSVFRQKRLKNMGLTEDNVLSLSYGSIVRRNIRSSDGLVPDSYETYQIVDVNDIVFRFTDLQNDKRSLRSARVLERGIITSAYVSATPTGIHPGYANYLMRSYDLAKVFYALGGGVRQTLKFSDVATLPILSPPIEEQRDIADYLDRETKKIDELIAEQRSLIETLRERRQAVIDLALEEFIWDVPLGSICDLIQTGPFGSQLKADEYVYGGVAVINPTHFTAGIIVPNPDVSVSSEVAQRLSRHALRKGDVITARRGILGSCAVVTEVDLPAICGTGSAILRPNNTIIPEFLAHVLTTRRCRQDLELVGVGATMVSINSTMLSRLRFPRPTTEQQEAAVDKTSTDISRIDELITESEDLIALSQERRAALIAAAVTGQIDVRTTA